MCTLFPHIIRTCSLSTRCTRFTTQVIYIFLFYTVLYWFSVRWDSYLYPNQCTSCTCTQFCNGFVLYMVDYMSFHSTLHFILILETLISTLRQHTESEHSKLYSPFLSHTNKQCTFTTLSIGTAPNSISKTRSVTGDNADTSSFECK